MRHFNLVAAAVLAMACFVRSGWALELTEATFDGTTKKGLWLIEHYSPKCKHCRAFAPTWAELVEAKGPLADSSDFHMAQVNCLAQMDLCLEHDVDRFPRIDLYRDGEKVDTFDDDRTFDLLSKYIDDHVREYSTKHKATIHPDANGKHIDDDGDRRPTHDPAAGIKTPNLRPVGLPSIPSPPPSSTTAAKAQPKAEQHGILLSSPNPYGKLISYGVDGWTGTKFDKLIRGGAKANAAGPSFVKYFAPWCPHCRHLAPVWLELASALKGHVNVVEVDCEANRQPCNAAKVQSFPTLIFYNDGEKVEYTGSRSLAAMKAFALKASAAHQGISEVSPAQLETISRREEVFFLYVHSHTTPILEQGVVEEAAKSLATTPVHIYKTTDPALLHRFSAYVDATSGSALLAFKDHYIGSPTRAVHPSVVLSDPAMVRIGPAGALASWLAETRLPTLVEVTASTFSEVVYPDRPNLVVLAALSDSHHVQGALERTREAEVKSLRTIAKQWPAGKRVRDKPVVFAWMDADRFARFIKSSYDIKESSLPAIVVVDGARMEYYPIESSHSKTSRPYFASADDIFSTLEAINRKLVRPKSSQNFVQRGAQHVHDFLESLEDMAKRHPFLAAIGFIIVAVWIVLILKRLIAEDKRQLHAGAEKYYTVGSNVPRDGYPKAD